MVWLTRTSLQKNANGEANPHQLWPLARPQHQSGTRPQKPHRPAPAVKLVSKSNWEDELQDRQRVPGHRDAPMTSAGLKEGGKRKKKQKEDSKKKKPTKGNH
ncbi:dnaJ-like subfamily B member 6 isoform X1 [Sigmodon hispidus]